MSTPPSRSSCARTRRRRSRRGTATPRTTGEGRQGRVVVPRPPRPQLARGRTAPGPGADARLLLGTNFPVLHEAPRQRPHRHRYGGGGRWRGRPEDHQIEEVRKSTRRWEIKELGEIRQ